MESLRHLAAHFGLDLAAVGVLTFAIYYPRHRRRDLVPAYLALNTGLFTVVTALAEVRGGGGAALGFGLFGVLSIVRLRSDAVQHQEVAYYFTTLVLGLLCGLPRLPFALTAGLCATLLLIVWAADSPRLLAGTRRAVVTLDAVHEDPAVLHADLVRRLGEPLHWTVMEVDFVRDLTVVDVRYRESAAAPAGRGSAPAAGPAPRTTPAWETA
ncbi:DUF4956 domain-containing protein [Streptomyces roseochromogenus]|uniref:DUF4956 domain-containing protein n=1 Tax=Streptomyces roseochromogenus subsp. oscitans DS 12.976 TaxID=1352936 RepID=V6KZG4_STRRC|nr:DUF4956 domain-containing protein [Streptomyces roseochromogenus]EST34369.1 hypothetical protein M878_10255 [Streptomyces roseochromogenus subsp. oscitans DS 12.976]